MTEFDPIAAWRNNPFFVLEVGTDASPTEVERAGQKLLGLLAVGSGSVANFDTPIGPATRDADSVRQAMARLRDPGERVICELWATIVPPSDRTRSDNPAAAWNEAENAIGWAGKWPA